MKLFRLNVPKRIALLGLAAIVASSLSFPSTALAKVSIDGAKLVKGENSVGGGTATLNKGALDVNGVTATTIFTDEDLDVLFSGGNEIGEMGVAESSKVCVDFEGENEVEDFYALGTSELEINANGHNEFDEIKAYDAADVTVNVTGKNDVESIVGYDDASVTVRGTTCQKRDILNLGEDEEDAEIVACRGNLVIDHVTVNAEAEATIIGSDFGDVTIDTSKIAKDDDCEYVMLNAGGTMSLTESVIDIDGTVSSDGTTTINHSDVKVGKPDEAYETRPYAVYSRTGIKLINERNGDVLVGRVGDDKVWYVDTGEGGESVDLKADGTPAYYMCKGSSIPKTGDESAPWGIVSVGFASLIAGWYALRRRRELEQGR